MCNKLLLNACLNDDLSIMELVVVQSRDPHPLTSFIGRTNGDNSSWQGSSLADYCFLGSAGGQWCAYMEAPVRCEK